MWPTRYECYDYVKPATKAGEDTTLFSKWSEVNTPRLHRFYINEERLLVLIRKIQFIFQDFKFGGVDGVSGEGSTSIR